MTVQELNALFGKNVRYYRKKKGWRQMRLAEELGARSSLISDYECGRRLPHYKQLVLLGYLLDVDIYMFFMEEKTKTYD